MLLGVLAAAFLKKVKNTAPAKIKAYLYVGGKVVTVVYTRYNVILIENSDFNEIVNLEQSVENGTYMRDFSEY